MLGGVAIVATAAAFYLATRPAPVAPPRSKLEDIAHGADSVLGIFGVKLG